ncbi:response regulator [Fodinicurvata sediminis]|uniref:response regulator n=1 Tax=Fodinicurvata sediminis TaxID=1121832 RepID=UPI0003B4F027|nr:response regulator [Fodinicurvata sediminis]
MRTVLLIDDEKTILEAMGYSLSKAGYTVFSAANGKEGLAFLDSQPVDAVVTDIIMPEKEGLETIIEIRRKWPDLPIVAISGGGRTRQLHFLEMSRDFGANEIMQKPFKPSQLIESLNRLLDAGHDSLPA